MADALLIKRVIGLPGEEIEIVAGRLVIDSVSVDLQLIGPATSRVTRPWLAELVAGICAKLCQMTGEIRLIVRPNILLWIGGNVLVTTLDQLRCQKGTYFYWVIIEMAARTVDRTVSVLFRLTI